ncbi:hypothetical protein [Streptomyces albus]|uniref:hypothetical protein n=1 Tax=Streptomyces albus TaxID=1888 RepID=UPI0006E3C3B9|nr:hypothetical protein [Streptomyces albus]
MSERLAPLVREILQDGEDDWVMLDSVVAYAWEHAEASGTAPEDVTKEFLTTLLGEDLMEIGDLAEEGFRPWDLPPLEAVDRCLADLESYDWEPRGALSWLSITEKGRCHLRELEGN